MKLSYLHSHVMLENASQRYVSFSWTRDARLYWRFYIKMNFYEYEVFSYFGESVSDSTLISFLDLMKKHLLVTKTVSYLKKKKRANQQCSSSSFVICTSIESKTPKNSVSWEASSFPKVRINWKSVSKPV